MKKVLTIILCVLLCVGVTGGSFSLAKQIDSNQNVEQSDENNKSGSEDSTDTVSVWQLCTSADDLAVGDQIVLAVQSEEYALGTTQNTSNRSAASIVKSGHTITLSDGVQIITLEAGIVENTFAFNVGTGYLYAPSSSSNQLKTHDSIDENSSWSITIDSSCVASIVAQGTSTRNTLLYNTASKLFSCYSSTQEPLMIYKLVEVENN